MSKKKNLAPRDQSSLTSPLDQGEADLIVGQPGYRNRRGRRGLDYIETQAEFGHSLGTLIRRLLSRRLRVRNPFSLLLLSLLGLVLCLPGFLVLAELVANPLSAAALLNTSSLRSQNFSLLSGGLTGGAIVALSSLVGVLLLVNVGKNMYRKGKARGRR